ncbi:hypothetical protein G6F40_017681 [Rhizopus arrhizus]|nr:hypothetical protein G6F40_017681 [Rhizopus arrhizus]
MSPRSSPINRLVASGLIFTTMRSRYGLPARKNLANRSSTISWPGLNSLNLNGPDPTTSVEFRGCVLMSCPSS